MKTKLFLVLLFISNITFSQITNPVQNNLERSYEFVNGTLTDTKNGVDLVQGAQSTVTLVPDRHGVPNDAVQFSNYPTTSYSQLTATPVGGARKKSFSFWMKTSTNDNTSRHIVNNGTAMVFLRDGKIGAHISGYHKATGKSKTTVAISKASTRTIDDGNWHHIVVNLEVHVPSIASNYRTLTYLYDFYIDGVHETQQAHTQSFYIGGTQPPYGYGFNTASSLNIGRNYEDIVDDISVYNGILTQAEVSTLYNPTVTIPDANFKNELINLVDTNFDGEIQVSEAASYIGTINVNGKNIADLTGIEAFRKVTVLNCSNNQLTSLDLSRNIALTTVDCSANQITGNIDISENKALTSFNISSNNVITLNVANTNNTNLTILNTTTNANLVCINPDAGFTPTASWLKDATAFYSDTCFPKLTTNVVGDGSITINPISADSTYTYATAVALTPNPASANHQFTGWSGDATGTTNPLNITINSDTNITANFSFIPTTFYVNKNVTGGNNDGSSWANAFSTIQGAINAAGAYGDEIWIAKGTYTPHASNRNTSFYINKDKLKVYGGFTGTETQLSQRDMTKIHTDNATILSGDLNNDDTGLSFAAANRTENSYHVVEVSKENTMLDGLIISDGQGDFVAASGDNTYGAGIFKAFKIRKFTMKNTVVKDNVAPSAAGLMLKYDAYQATNTNAVYTIDKCVFKNNLAQSASALYVSPYINTANTINLSITNSLFDSNKTVDYLTKKAIGGSNGYIESMTQGTISVVIVNNTFVNSMNNGTGGGEYASLIISRRNPGVLNGVVANNIFWGNISNGATSKAIGNKPHNSYVSIAGSLISNSIDEDNFSNLTGTVNTNNTNPNLDADFKLQATSLSALNSGSNSKLPSNLTKDLSGNDRVYNGVIDLGAYEFLSGAITSTAWTGATDTSWNTASNWNNGVPTNTLNAFVFNGVTNYPVISNSVSAKDITIENSASLTISPSANLTAENIITNDNLIIESDVNNYGSLKVTNSVTGKATYKSYVSDKWNLVGSPVVGQDVASFVTNSSLVSGTVNPNHKGLGIYENANAAPWTYYKNTLSWGNFDTAKAYAIKKTTAGTVDFTGTITTDNVQYIATGNANNTFEMISNPYTAYLNANSGANSILSENSSNLKSTNAALYFWNDTTKNYDVVNNTSSPSRLKPGQGFFVQMATTNGVVNFTPAMLLHQQSSSSRQSVQTSVALTISDEKSKGNTSKTTQIKYLSNTNDGLDVGYDAGYFDGGQSKVGVYTKLADGTYNDTDFMLQCVNKEKISGTIIPVGIKTSEAREVVFSAKAMNLPENLNVYLEDKETNKVTELSNGGEYKATVSGGSGRFYVHTKTSSNLNPDTIVLKSKLSVYKANNSLIINGLEEKATVNLYNMIGKQVFTQEIQNTTKTVVLPSLASGIYIVKVQSGTTQISKKISIQ
ncbi:T9SS type A sorting domain-containing protein [Tenacibaculum piscium]|uniref:T9SS type A sorting domain-containing protein n=3 Tax=Tenacibaculum piscium TaxID=1458515 RepID=UPI001F248EFD|nr:T9SS type A sorting domain-containing protein [Tenacibaculum piscium]